MPTDLTTSSSDVSMTSLEISSLVKSRHPDVRRSIERLANQEVIELPPTATIPTATKPVTVYVFSGKKGKRDSTIVVAQLSPAFTARLVDRWEELEERLKAPQQPTLSLEDEIQKEVRHLLNIGLDTETAYSAAAQRVADDHGIEKRLLIQSDEMTGRRPGWGQLPIKGISEEEVKEIREEAKYKEMIWHPRQIAERFNLYDRKGQADTRLVFRILEAAGQLRIIEPVSQTIEVTSEGKDVCYFPRSYTGGPQYGNATRWEVAYFARCYLKFIDKHSYEFVNFKTY